MFIILKRLLPLLGLLFCAIPSHAQSTISAVVSGSCASSPTTCTTSSTLNISSSDTVVVFVQTSNADCNDTATDSASVFTFAVQACAATGNSGSMEMFVGTSTGAAATDSFTAHFIGATSSVGPTIVAMQVTGGSTVIISDASAIGSTTATNVVTTGAFSTTRAAEIIIQCSGGDFNASAWTAGAIGGGSGTLVTGTSLSKSSHYAIACQSIHVSSLQTLITGTMTATGTSISEATALVTLKDPFPFITPETPSVNPGATQSFSCTVDCGTGASWSCITLPSCVGSINSSTGLYTAPATLAANQSLAGYQLFDNGHVYNVNISGFPLRSDSASIITASSTCCLNVISAQPVNLNPGSTPTDTMKFQYTPNLNGTFTVPQWTSAGIQNGWFDARVNGNNDHHMITIDTTTGNISEMYQYYAVGLNGACLTCNSQGGRKYTVASTNLASITNGEVNAAQMDIAPLLLRGNELVNACENSIPIQHALQYTLSGGHIRNSSPVSLWPANASIPSFGPAGAMFYGARVRLKAAVDISSFSACSQTVLTALKNYGMFLIDGGLNMQVGIEYTNLPATEAAAVAQLYSSNLPLTDFEVVDESSLELSASSGLTPYTETVQYTSSSGTSTTTIALQGTAVNVRDNQVYVMAGTPQFQLVGYPSGSITWSMSPTVGSLTSGGLYTAPATEASMTTTTVTATSTVNSAVKAQLILYVFPQTGIYITQGTTNYTDSKGTVWNGAYGIGLSNAPSIQGCCQNNASFPGVPDKQLWWNHYASSFSVNDLKMDFHVPSGTYKLTYNLGTVVAPGNNANWIYVQGVSQGSVDPAGVVGINEPYTYIQPSVQASSNLISFYLSGIGKQANNTGDISSFSVVPGLGSFLPGGVKITGVQVQ